MKSKLFQMGVEENFYKDIQLFDRYPKDKINDLVKIVNQFSTPRYFPSNENLRPLSQSSGFSAKELVRITRFVIYVYPVVSG